MVSWVKMLPVTPASRMAAPPVIQLPVTMLGKPVEESPITWVTTPKRETWMNVLAVAFIMGQAQLVWLFGQ